MPSARISLGGFKFLQLLVKKKKNDDGNSDNGNCNKCIIHEGCLENKQILEVSFLMELRLRRLIYSLVDMEFEVDAFLAFFLNFTILLFTVMLKNYVIFCPHLSGYISL